MRLAKSQSAYKSTIIFLFSSIKTKKEHPKDALFLYILYYFFLPSPFFPISGKVGTGVMVPADGLFFLVKYNGFVLRNQGLHDAPANQVSNGADAEDYHITCGFAFEAHECEC